MQVAFVQVAKSTTIVLEWSLAIVASIQTIRECIISPKSEYKAAKGNFYKFRIIAVEKYRWPLVFTILR
jgi:hypothetical protein